MRQLRIATLGDYYKWFSYYLMITAQGSFLNGHLHCPIPIRQSPRQIEQQINYFKPSILFCHMIFSENLTNTETGEDLRREDLHEIIARAKKKWGTKVIYQEGDAKNDPRYPFPTFGIIDLGLVNSRRYEHFSNVMKVPFVHWPYCALNQENISPGDNLFRYNAVFSGNVSVRNNTHLHYGRYEFIERLKEKIDVKIFPDENIGNTRFCTADLAASAGAVIGIQHGYHVDGYVDTRPFQNIGAGALYFHDDCPGINQFFKPYVHYMPYKKMDAEDFINQYNYCYTEHPELVSKIRQDGFEYCQKHHTSKHRVQMALDMLDGKDPAKIYLKDLEE
jgi:hypothetical protein